MRMGEGGKDKERGTRGGEETERERERERENKNEGWFCSYLL